MQATLSADIVRSTSLSKEDMLRIQLRLQEFVSQVGSVSPGSWGRVVRGDGVEIVVENERDSLRLALLLRYWIKSMPVEDASARFLKDRIRVAIGLGGLRTSDATDGVIDGEAIYASGRALSGMTRDSLVIVCGDDYRRDWIDTLAMLLDALVSGTTRMQSTAMYDRLLGKSPLQIGKSMKRSEQAIYSLLRNAGSRAVEQALHTFEQGEIRK